MSIQRSAGAVLTMLLALGAGQAWAQYADGNVDNDGFQVATFPVPGGSASISNSGEGIVTIPLTAPPGVRGMAPKLSLGYSSEGGDAGLGKGWSLDLGFPDAIRRATRLGVPAYGDPGSTNDVFTFAGQDLVPVGSGRYKTRVDDFRRIEWASGHWVVREKNGTRLVYGETAAERSAVTLTSPPAPCTTCVYAWHLSKVVDTFGNTIAFSYEPESGPSPESLRLRSIAYGVPDGRVQNVVLEWEGREDVRREATNGAMVAHDARLQRIEMQSGGALVRKYELTFADLTARRLISVQEIGADGTAPPGWAFTYSDHDGLDAVRSGRLPTVNGRDVLFIEGENVTARYLDGGVRAADVNGDGLVDLVAGLQRPLVDDNWVLLNDGAGWGNTPAPGWTLPHRFVVDDVDQGMRLVDVNGDGLPEAIKSRDGSPRAIYMNTGLGWGPANAGYQFPAALPALVGGGPSPRHIRLRRPLRRCQRRPLGRPALREARPRHPHPGKRRISERRGRLGARSPVVGGAPVPSPGLLLHVRSRR